MTRLEVALCALSSPLFTCAHPTRLQLVPDGVVGITRAGQGTAWAVQTLGAQPLLAAWAFVARFTLTGASGGRTLAPVVAVTALRALEAEGPEGALLLAPAGQQRGLRLCPSPALPDPSIMHPPSLQTWAWCAAPPHSFLPSSLSSSGKDSMV